MKRILPILLILLFLLSSCNTPTTQEITQDSSKAPLPNEDENSFGSVLYIANTSSKTYHLPSCYLVSRISEENRLETKDIDFLRSRKYTSCKACMANY